VKTKNKKSLISLAGLFLALPFAVWLWTGNDNVVDKQTALESQQVPEEVNQKPKLELEKTVSPTYIETLVKQETITEQDAALFYENLPGSLKGAPKPAALNTDTDGNLIIDKRVQRLFEFFLMAMGEEPIENIISRIKHAMRNQMNESSYLQAENILEGYLQHRNNVGVIKNQFAEIIADSGTNMNVIREVKFAIREARSSFLSGEVISAFYSQEDLYDDYMMNKVDILNDASLSTEQKQLQLSLLDENSSSIIVQSQKQATHISTVRNTVNELREYGATDDEVHFYREQELGYEVAERMKALDEQRKQWQSRVDQYRAELATITLSGSYTPDTVASLREQYFQGGELLRIQALDKNKVSASLK